jgi:nitrogen fixation/metabolism regulation signal transduction histidine kinase
MTLVNAQSLPWYLIGVLVTALLAVFYALLRGKVLSNRVAELLRESAEKRAEAAEGGVAANTKSVESLVDSVAKLLVLAETQEKVLRALSERADRVDPRRRGGT